MNLRGKKIILGKLFSGLSNKTIVADSTGGNVQDAIDMVNEANEKGKVIKLIPEPQASVGIIGHRTGAFIGKEILTKATMCGISVNTEGANQGYLIENAEAIEKEVHQPTKDGDLVLERMHELQRQLGRDYSVMEFLIVIKLLGQGREVMVVDGRLHTPETEADKAVSKERIEAILSKPFFGGSDPTMVTLEPNQLYNREVEQVEHLHRGINIETSENITGRWVEGLEGIVAESVPIENEVKHSLEDYLEQETALQASAPSPREGESYSSTSYLERLVKEYPEQLGGLPKSNAKGAVL
jgi:hypothetical protein